MKINIAKSHKGAAATSTLLGIGMAVLVVAIAVPAIAMSFSPMALWKSPETVPGVSPSSVQYDADGTPTGQGSLVADAPVIKELGAENLKNYNAWIKYINDGAAGTSASPALLLAILYEEHDRTFPDPAGECTDGSKCISPHKCEQKWCVSSSDAYGPFQFLNRTWSGYGLTPAELKVIKDANPNLDLDDGSKPISSTMFDPARAAKGAAAYVGANIDVHDGDLATKIKMAITRYNASPTYISDVQGYYATFVSALDSAGSGNEPALVGDLQSKIVQAAKYEATLSSAISDKPPKGYHTKNELNCVKYLNSSVNDTTSQNCAAWCAAFANWVYRKAGYDIPASASNTMLIDYFSKNGHTFKFRSDIVNPYTDILKGDIIIMNSGTSNSGYHAGIVVDVTREGIITSVEGNLGKGTVDKVAERPHTMSETYKDCKDYNSITKTSSNCTSYVNVPRIYGVARW
ncbi:MAG: CHAP domain-containing protein [Candidatus Berkelbacteria bacterium]